MDRPDPGRARQQRAEQRDALDHAGRGEHVLHRLRFRSGRLRYLPRRCRAARISSGVDDSLVDSDQRGPGRQWALLGFAGIDLRRWKRPLLFERPPGWYRRKGYLALPPQARWLVGCPGQCRSPCQHSVRRGDPLVLSRWQDPRLCLRWTAGRGRLRYLLGHGGDGHRAGLQPWNPDQLLLRRDRLLVLGRWPALVRRLQPPWRIGRI